MASSHSLQRPLSTVTGYVRLIVRSLEKAGLNGAQLCKQAGIDYSLLDDQHARIEQQHVTRLWQAAVVASSNDAIALQLLDNISADAFHLLGYSFLSSMNLLEGCQRFIRYQRCVGELFIIKLHLEGDEYFMDFDYREQNNPSFHQSMDAAITTLVGVIRWLTQNHDLSPSSVMLSRTTPKDKSLYTKAFGCDVTFNCPVNRVLVKKDIMLHTIPTAHAEIALLNDGLLGRYLASIDRKCSSDLVREKLTAMLPSGTPKSENIAKVLNMSNRTLHRRLKEEDTSFKVILESTRKQLSVVYLENPDISLKEISYLLGFSEPSNFYRAFKRWYGVPPGQYGENKH